MPRNNYHDTPVVEFHEAFGAPVAWHPTHIPRERQLLRLKLILEELIELADALGFVLMQSVNDVNKFEFLHREAGGYTTSVDLVEVADALTDIRYVTDGACVEFGLPGEKLLREVHRSNMSKLGDDGKPILREDGKILKGPNFTPPDLRTIIELYSHMELNNRG